MTPANLPIVKKPNEILKQSAEKVPLNEISGERIRKLVADMKETLKNTPDGVGLAAPQVGKSLRIFIISEEAEEIDEAERSGRKRGEGAVSKNKEPREQKKWRYYVFINPEVKKISRRKLGGAEGCLSVPGKYGAVKRNEKITIEAYDESGQKFARGASRFFARAIQHELDHLNGVLFMDKAEKLFEIDSNAGRQSG